MIANDIRKHQKMKNKNWFSIEKLIKCEKKKTIVINND